MTTLVVGDIVTDILAVYSGSIAVGSDTGAAISLTGGGSAANTAAWLASVQVPVELVGMVGADRAGEERLAELREAGVGTRFVARTGERPTGSVIVLADGDERSFLCDRGANLLLGRSDVDAALIGAGAVHLHLSGYTLLDDGSRAAGRYSLTAARERGLTTSVDAASAAPLRRADGFLDWIQGVDIVFANEDEAGVLGSALTTAAANVVIKRGVAGAEWLGVGVAAARPATAVDTTGAGDAFAAGFLAGWLSGEEPATVLTRATELGAAAVATLGGRPPPRRRH